MNGEKLIDAVAELWVENGGDEDGILWCVNKIAMSVRAKLKEKEEEQNEASSHSIRTPLD